MAQFNRQEIDDYFDTLTPINVKEITRHAEPVVESLTDRPAVLRGTLNGIGGCASDWQWALALYVVGFMVGAHFANRRADLSELAHVQHLASAQELGEGK